MVVSSVVGQVARPYAAADGMTAAALRSMAGAVRQELRLGGVRGVAGEHRAGRGLLAGRPHGDLGSSGSCGGPRLEVVAGGPFETALTAATRSSPA